MKTRNTQALFVGLFFFLACIIPTTISAQSSQGEKYKASHYHQKSVKQPTNTIHIKGNKQIKKYRNYSAYKAHKNTYTKIHYQHNTHLQENKQYSVVYHRLPPKSRMVYLNNRKYYHHNNHYYMHTTHGGYVLVNPPKYVSSVPHRAVKTYYKGHKAFMHEGIYFSWTPYGFVIL